MSNNPNLTKITIAIALILTWVSIWFSFKQLSYTGNPFTDTSIIAGSAGFPFTVFYYPPAAMGNDIPDQGSIFPFALNLMLYFIITWVVINFIPVKNISKRFEQLIVYIAFWVTLGGLFYTILMYD